MPSIVLATSALAVSDKNETTLKGRKTMRDVMVSATPRGAQKQGNFTPRIMLPTNADVRQYDNEAAPGSRKPHL